MPPGPGCPPGSRLSPSTVTTPSPLPPCSLSVVSLSASVPAGGTAPAHLWLGCALAAQCPSQWGAVHAFHGLWGRVISSRGLSGLGVDTS